VELAKAWRSDKYLRRLEATIVACDPSGIFTVDGMGNVLEGDEGVLAAGSGGYFAAAAAKALYDIDGLTAEQICAKAMKVATQMDIHSNETHDILKVVEGSKEATSS
jgi:ATP-dependent HslUV protease subunit HslV